MMMMMMMMTMNIMLKMMMQSEVLQFLLLALARCSGTKSGRTLASRANKI